MEDNELICYQYKIREEKELEQSKELSFLKDNANLKNTVVRKITFGEAKTVILEYEWLKSMPLYNKFMFGLFFVIDDKEYLGGVVIYSEEYSNNTDVWDKYTFNNKMLLLSRGVCIWWTPKNTASFFISKTFEYIRKNSEYECITATVDPLAGEVGIIYQSLNFSYAGLMGGNYDKSGNEYKRLQIIIDNKTYSSKTIRKKLGSTKKEVVLAKYPDAKYIYTLRKRRYFYFIKNRKVHLNSIKDILKPYPTKQDICDLLQNTNGVIYKITNLVNSKIYIGQTTKKLEIRIGTHKKDSNKNNTYLNRAFAKYGFDNFKFEIIEQCKSVNELNEREVYYINLYNSTNREIGYNIHGGGRNKLITQETKDKMSKIRKGTVQSEEWVSKRKRFGEDHHCFGKTHSEEYNKDISDKMKVIKVHLKGKPREDKEAVDSMRNTKIAKYGKKVEQFNRITGEGIKVYDSIGQAVTETNGNFGTVVRHCNLQVKRYVSDISWRWFLG
jgi:group I intron endonuclease